MSIEAFTASYQMQLELKQYTGAFDIKCDIYLDLQWQQLKTGTCKATKDLVKSRMALIIRHNNNSIFASNFPR